MHHLWAVWFCERARSLFAEGIACVANSYATSQYGSRTALTYSGIDKSRKSRTNFIIVFKVCRCSLADLSLDSRVLELPHLDQSSYSIPDMLLRSISCANDPWNLAYLFIHHLKPMLRWAACYMILQSLVRFISNILTCQVSELALSIVQLSS